MSILTEKQREAKRVYEREWRRKKWANDPDYKRRKKETDNRWRQKTIDAVRDYKLKAGCSRCGYKECSRALQFHHITGDKDYTVSEMFSRYHSPVLIWKEIEKCIVLCANCHAKEHCEKDC